MPDGHLILGDSKVVGTQPVANLTSADFTTPIPGALECRQLNGESSETVAALDINTSPDWSFEHRTAAWAASLGQTPFIFRRGRSGGSLGSHSRPWVDGDDYSDLVRMFWRQLALNGGGTPRTATVMLGANDAQSSSLAAAWEQNLRALVIALKRDFGSISIALCQLGSDADGSSLGSPLTHLSTIRSGTAAVAASFPLVQLVDETGVPTHDGVHFTADGNMIVGGRIVAAHQLNGIRSDGFSNRIDVYDTLAAAQAAANALQTSYGDRNENPALGGLGVGATSNWPVTPRSRVLKHPAFDIYGVLRDPAAAGDVAGLARVGGWLML